MWDEPLLLFYPYCIDARLPNVMVMRVIGPDDFYTTMTAINQTAGGVHLYARTIEPILKQQPDADVFVFRFIPFIGGETAPHSFVGSYQLTDEWIPPHNPRDLRRIDRVAKLFDGLMSDLSARKKFLTYLWENQTTKDSPTKPKTDTPVLYVETAELSRRPQAELPFGYRLWSNGTYWYLCDGLQNESIAIAGISPKQWLRIEIDDRVLYDSRDNPSIV